MAWVETLLFVTGKYCVGLVCLSQQARLNCNAPCFSPNALNQHDHQDIVDKGQSQQNPHHHDEAFFKQGRLLFLQVFEPLPEGRTDGDSDCMERAVSLRLLSSSVASCVATAEARQPLPEGRTDGDSDCMERAVSLRMLSSSVASCVATAEARRTSLLCRKCTLMVLDRDKTRSSTQK